MAEPARCRSCTAEIRWATLPDGKFLPLDAQPVEDGNVAAYLDDRGDLRARMLRVGEEPAEHERRGVTHFATCPNGSLHRRGARA